MFDQAVELCRAPGFRSTAFCDLTAELGISRRSLYATDGDKQLLLPASLQWYRERSLDQLRRFLDTPGPVRPVLAQLFEGVISGPCAKGNPGCFMVNSLVEMAPQDEAIRAMALAPARDLAGLFAARLSAPQRGSSWESKSWSTAACATPEEAFRATRCDCHRDLLGRASDRHRRAPSSAYAPDAACSRWKVRWARSLALRKVRWSSPARVKFSGVILSKVSSPGRP